MKPLLRPPIRPRDRNPQWLWPNPSPRRRQRSHRSHLLPLVRHDGWKNGKESFWTRQPHREKRDALQRETRTGEGRARTAFYHKLQHSDLQWAVCHVFEPTGPVVIDHSGLIDKKHTDSTLIVGTSVLSVHKAIISARNDQLLAGVAPKKNKKGGFDYDIKDIEFPIMRVVVQWLYSGTRKSRFSAKKARAFF